MHHSAVDRTDRLARLVQSEGFSDMMADEITNLIDCHMTYRRYISPQTLGLITITANISK